MNKEKNIIKHTINYYVPIVIGLNELKIMSWGPFNSFPRQMGYPIRGSIVFSMKEFLEKANLHDGKTNVYVSLYAFDHLFSDGKPDYESARLEHLFFDLDNSQALSNATKIHEYLKEQDLIHTMFFSGGGFHIYIAVDYPNFIKNKKDAILNAVISIADKLGLTVGINEDSDIDAHTVGNIAQMVRVPNTWNLKRKRFCIPINEVHLKSQQELEYSYDHQNNWITVYGHKYFDITPFDKEPVAKYRVPNIENSTNSIGIDNLDFEKFAPCIKNMINRKLYKHRHRYIIITYFKEMGLSLEDTILLLRKYLDPQTFNHCIHEERQPIWIYRRGDLSFPKCEKLKMEKLCVEDCRKV